MRGRGAHVHINIIQQKREAVCSSRFPRASQSPLMVEKQLMPHAEYANLTYTKRVREGYDCISRGHSLLTATTISRMLRRFWKVANSVNKRLLCQYFASPRNDINPFRRDGRMELLQRKGCFWKASIPHLAISTAKLLQKFDICKDFGKKLKNILVFSEILVFERECATVISVGP